MPQAQLLTQEDLMIAARTVWGEARGEPYDGKLAVACVMVNRWRRVDGQFARDDTLASACLRHLQFSAWNAGDPNFAALQRVQVDDQVFRECLRAVLVAVDAVADPTVGAVHYHAKGVLPDWARGHRPSATIGGHLFYNDVA